MRRGDDLEALGAMAGRVHEVDGYPMHLPGGDVIRFMTHPEPVTAWVAVEGDRIVGHVALNPSTSVPVMQLVDELDVRAVYVARLLVDQEFRRCGVGARLLEHARCEAVVGGFVPFLDVVDIPRAAAAIGLYRNEGWQEVGRVSFELVGNAVEEIVFRGPGR